MSGEDIEAWRERIGHRSHKTSRSRDERVEARMIDRGDGAHHVAFNEREDFVGWCRGVGECAESFLELRPRLLDRNGAIAKRLDMIDDNVDDAMTEFSHRGGWQLQRVGIGHPQP